MQIHRKLILLVGLGLLLIMTITVLTLQENTDAFRRTNQETGQVFAKLQQLRAIEKHVAVISLATHNFHESAREQDRQAYLASRWRVREALKDLNAREHTSAEGTLLASLAADFTAFDKLSNAMFTAPAAPRKKTGPSPITDGIDRFSSSITKTIEQLQEEQTLSMGKVVIQLREDQSTTRNLFLINLLVSATFLLAFGIFLHRRVSMPLARLGTGTEEISKGNLDYRITVTAEREISLLADRFNEMASRLQQSHQELEQKLLARTHNLAALGAVALTLGESRTMHDLLSRSLDHIFMSLTNLEPRGGVFLRDPEGEILRLAVQKGLPPEFSRQEETIRMGECLCGIVAQNGEILVTDRNCKDPRHTRCSDTDAHSHIIIPIKSRGMVHGVIFLYPGADFTLQPSDTQLLETIGAQLGLAVENFQFYSEVKASSEKFWDLFENAQEIFVTVDAAGTVMATNRTAERFFGYSKLDFARKNAMDLLAAPRDIEAIRQALTGEGGPDNQVLEVEAVKRDGGHAFLEVNLRMLRHGQVQAGFHISARDVTEQKALREAVLKAERQGALGEMGVAIRHEINNPLTTVIGNVELLIERYEGKDKDLTTRLEAVLNNALRIADIVKRLKAAKQDRTVGYLKDIKMTDLKQEDPR